MYNFKITKPMKVQLALFLIIILLTCCKRNNEIIPPSTKQLSLQQLYSDSTVNLYSVWFINENTGYVCGSGGKILKTINGGQSWTLLNTGVTGIISSIRFTNLNTGFACDQDGNILKTEDGGTTWQILNFPYNNQLKTIFFLDENTGFVGGRQLSMSSKAKIFKTNDAGLSWSEPNDSLNHTNLGLKYYHINSLFFTNSSNGYFVSSCIDLGGDPLCSGYYIGKTNDGGNNWFLKYTNISQFYNIYFTNPQVGFAVGKNNFGGIISKTIDEGENWNEQLIDYCTLRTVYFSDNNIGFIAGDSGKIWQTIDGAINWNKLSTISTNNLYAIHFPNTSTGYVVGNNGTIIKITYQ